MNGKLKFSSTIDFLGIDIDTCGKWIEFQMTPNMTWDKIEIDQMKPICMFDVSNDGELKEALNLEKYSTNIKRNSLI